MRDGTCQSDLDVFLWLQPAIMRHLQSVRGQARRELAETAQAVVDIGELLYQMVPALLTHVGRYLAWRRREQRRERMAARIMRRLVMNPRSLDVLIERLQSEDIVA